jgi:hypothetical protein
MAMEMIKGQGAARSTRMSFVSFPNIWKILDRLESFFPHTAQSHLENVVALHRKQDIFSRIVMPHSQVERYMESQGHREEWRISSEGEHIGPVQYSPASIRNCSSIHMYPKDMRHRVSQPHERPHRRPVATQRRLNYTLADHRQRCARQAQRRQYEEDQQLKRKFAHPYPHDQQAKVYSQRISVADISGTKADYLVTDHVNLSYMKPIEYPAEVSVPTKRNSTGKSILKSLFCVGFRRKRMQVDAGGCSRAGTIQVL